MTLSERSCYETAMKPRALSRNVTRSADASNSRYVDLTQLTHTLNRLSYATHAARAALTGRVSCHHTHTPYVRLVHRTLNSSTIRTGERGRELRRVGHSAAASGSAGLLVLQTHRSLQTLAQYQRWTRAQRCRWAASPAEMLPAQPTSPSCPQNDRRSCPRCD